MKPSNDRSLAIDALRGYAIITMVLSATVMGGILPGWMYHCQEPPPTHAYDAAIAGVTWVDLVFPAFLFAMGAALPQAHKAGIIARTAGNIMFFICFLFISHSPYF